MTGLSPRRPGRPRKAAQCDCGNPGVVQRKSDWICARCQAWEEAAARESRRASQQLRRDRELKTL